MYSWEFLLTDWVGCQEKLWQTIARHLSEIPFTGDLQKLKPTTRELATILAALRYWQANNVSDSKLEEVFAEHFAETTPLTTIEINDLCEKLNCSVRKLSKTHADVRLPSISSRATIQNVVV